MYVWLMISSGHVIKLQLIVTEDGFFWGISSPSWDRDPLLHGFLVTFLTLPPLHQNK